MSGRRQIDIPRFVWFAVGSELEGEPSLTGSPCALRIYQASGKDLGVGVYVSMRMSMTMDTRGKPWYHSSRAIQLIFMRQDLLLV